MLTQSWKRSLAWCCIIVVTTVTALGQSLHQLVGEHACCSQAATASHAQHHVCGDVACPFSTTPTALSADDNSEPVDSSHVADGGADGCSSDRCQSSDCCSVCRLLAHLSNGAFLYLDNEIRAASFRMEVAFSQLELPNRFCCYVARGPPTFA